MADHPMTRYIPIGDVELPLPLIARALGIPAATLDKLASGEWVAVPMEPTAEMHMAGYEKSIGGQFGEWMPEGFPAINAAIYRAMLAAATEAASHE